MPQGNSGMCRKSHQRDELWMPPVQKAETLRQVPPDAQAVASLKASSALYPSPGALQL